MLRPQVMARHSSAPTCPQSVITKSWPHSSRSTCLPLHIPPLRPYSTARSAVPHRSTALLTVQLVVQQFTSFLLRIQRSQRRRPSAHCIHTMHQQQADEQISRLLQRRPSTQLPVRALLASGPERGCQGVPRHFCICRTGRGCDGRDKGICDAARMGDGSQRFVGCSRQAV